MHIAVFVNNVIDAECPMALNEESETLEAAYLPTEVDPVALGSLAMIREAFAGDRPKITAVCLDAQGAEKAVRTCRAHGADDIAVVDTGQPDALATDAKARVAAAVVRSLGADAVLCSQRDAYGALDGFEAALAEELDWAQISNVCRVEPADEKGGFAVQRKLSHGDREKITAPTATVLAVDGLMADIPYPPFPFVLASQLCSVNVLGLEELGLKAGDLRSSAAVTRTGFMPPRPRTKRTAEKKSGAAALSAMMGGGAKKKSSGVVEAPANEAAEQIVSFLTEKDLV